MAINTSKSKNDRMNNVTLEDARVVFRNFSGKEGQYNREGDRNFAVILEDDLAEQMKADGWNVKYLKPREEDTPTPYVQVSVSYKGRPPRVVVITSKGRTSLTEQEVMILDWADFKTVDMILNPYQWSVNGNTGVKAYLQSIFVTILEDELELKYSDVPDSAQNSIGGNNRLQITAGGEDDEVIDAELVD